MNYKALKPYSAPPFALFHKPEDCDVKTLDVPGYRQSRNYSCGFAIVLMVLRYYKQPWCGKAIFEALGTARDGTGQTAIVRVLRQSELRANIRYDMDHAKISAVIESGKVLISYLEDEGHWVVVYGVGKHPLRVFIADPEPGKKCEYTWQEMRERLGGFAIVCSPRGDKTERSKHDAVQQLSLLMQTVED